MSRRVAITGLGTVTPFGVGVDALWQGLCDGRSAIDRISTLDPSGFACQLAAEVRDFKVRDYVPKSYRKSVKVMARDIELAVGAALKAVEHAGVTTAATDPDAPPTHDPARVACHIGAGLIAAEIPELARAFATVRTAEGSFDYGAWGEQGMNNLTPLWLLKYLPNMLACHVTILHNAQGPSNTITCSEASGLLCIGESTRVIQRGDADAGFAGSAESKLNPMGFVRMDFARRLAHVQAPEGSHVDGASVVRPYDPDAPGTVLGEGAGILILEEFQAARARGATILAEVAGFGAGHSPRSDDPERRSRGLRFAIEAALRDAGVTPADIDAVIPHACGTPDIDAEDAAALRATLGDHLAETEIITLAPAIGDAMAGAGGVSAGVGARCLAEGRLPARLNAGTPAPGLLAGPAPSREAPLGHILVCTQSLGGQNAAVVLRKAD